MRKLAFAVALLICTSAFAQKAPTSVRLIVPFPPGGPVDFVGRVLADGLRSQMGTAVIVDNRPGANGAVGVVALKQAPADGATLFVASSGMVTFSPHYEKSLPYDVARDLVPIVNAAYSDVGFIAANKVRAKDLREFVALAKSSAKPLSIGSAGQGNITHAYLELFKDVAAIELVHVPYKGASPALSDVLGGHIDGMFIALSTALPAAQAGKLKVLAVVGRRSAIAPEIPTITEQGFPGVEILPWFGLFALHGTPPSITSSLAGEFRAVINAEETKKKFASAGFTSWYLAGEDFSRMIQAESETWKRLINARNLRSD